MARSLAPSDSQSIVAMKRYTAEAQAAAAPAPAPAPARSVSQSNGEAAIERAASPAVRSAAGRLLSDHSPAILRTDVAPSMQHALRKSFHQTPAGPSPRTAMPQRARTSSKRRCAMPRLRLFAPVPHPWSPQRAPRVVRPRLTRPMLKATLLRHRAVRTHPPRP